MKITELMPDKDYRRPNYEKGTYIRFINDACYICIYSEENFSWNYAEGQPLTTKKLVKYPYSLTYSDIKADNYELIKKEDAKCNLTEKFWLQISKDVEEN